MLVLSSCSKPNTILGRVFNPVDGKDQVEENTEIIVFTYDDPQFKQEGKLYSVKTLKDGYFGLSDKIDLENYLELRLPSTANVNGFWYVNDSVYMLNEVELSSLELNMHRLRTVGVNIKLIPQYDYENKEIQRTVTISNDYGYVECFTKNFIGHEDFKPGNLARILPEGPYKYTVETIGYGALFYSNEGTFFVNYELGINNEISIGY